MVVLEVIEPTPEGGRRAYGGPVGSTIQSNHHRYSIIVPVLLVIALFSTVHLMTPPETLSAGLVRGSMVSSLVFLLAGLMFSNEKGPFIRPHPAVWRLVSLVCVLYLVGLVAMLFLSLDQARQLLSFLDQSLNVPLPENSYAQDCRIAWSAISPKLDIFVLAHLIGWYVRALILRDQWICWILSVMFELLEYSLQHQLPNFAECWWDHWLLDVLGCNWIGIWLGIKTCERLSMLKYEWRSIKDIPDLSGKLGRSIAQFTPYSWTSFDWATTKTFKGYLVTLLIVTFFLLSDLNCFYLKYLLWVPPPHYLNCLRLCLHALMGAPAVREAYQYFTDLHCKRLGAHSWIAMAIIVTESILCLKFGRGQFPNPCPSAVLWSWLIGLSLVLVVFPLYKFTSLREIVAKEETRNKCD